MLRIRNPIAHPISSYPLWNLSFITYTKMNQDPFIVVDPKLEWPAVFFFYPFPHMTFSSVPFPRPVPGNPFEKKERLNKALLLNSDPDASPISRVNTKKVICNNDHAVVYHKAQNKKHLPPEFERALY